MCCARYEKGHIPWCKGKKLGPPAQPFPKGNQLWKKAGYHGLPGHTNPNWKGGRSIDSTRGYIRIRRPGHHKAARDGRVYEHILVYEESRSCCILPWGIVHHINGITSDNRPENLELMNRKKHGMHHNKVDMSDRFCSNCGSKETWTTTTRNGERRPRWLGDGKSGFICGTCYRNRRHNGRQ